MACNVLHVRGTFNAFKPKSVQAVVDRMNKYYLSENANVHRGVHYLSSLATTAFEEARLKLAKFLNARDSREVIWTHNASEGINLVARSWGDANLKQGDEVRKFLLIKGKRSMMRYWVSYGWLLTL